MLLLPECHFVTGDLPVIKDYRIRNLISKDPKYGISSEIDVNASRVENANPIRLVCNIICKREHTKPSAFSNWKKTKSSK